MAYDIDIRSLLEQIRDTINTGNASTTAYGRGQHALLKSIRDLLNTGNASTSQYTTDINGLLTNIRDLLNTTPISVAKYTPDQLGLWRSLCDITNSVSVDMTKYPASLYGTIQAFRDIAILGGVNKTAPAPPIMSLNSEVAGLVSLNWDLTDGPAVAGDILLRQAQVSGGNWSSLADNSSHTITSGEAGSTVPNPPPSLNLGNGTWDIRGFITRIATGKTSADGTVNHLTITISDVVTGSHRVSSTGNNRISSTGNVRKYA